MHARNLVIGGVFKNSRACPSFVPRHDADPNAVPTCGDCSWRWDIFCRRCGWGWATIPGKQLPTKGPDATGTDHEYYE